MEYNERYAELNKRYKQLKMRKDENENREDASSQALLKILALEQQLTELSEKKPWITDEQKKDLL